MPLVYILADAPWGPIRLRTAGSMGELLDRLAATMGQAPAATVDVGERDPGEVVKAALRLMPPPVDSMGAIPATVDKASRIVAEAVPRIPARVVAADPGKPAPGKPESQGEGLASGEVGKTSFSERYAPACAHEAEPIARGRRRSGQEVDVRAIRAGLKLSQPAFAAAFGLKLAVLRDWEQGRTAPEGAARVLLATIAHRPDVVREVVEDGPNGQRSRKLA